MPVHYEGFEYDEAALAAPFHLMSQWATTGRTDPDRFDESDDPHRRTLQLASADQHGLVSIAPKGRALCSCALVEPDVEALFTSNGHRDFMTRTLATGIAFSWPQLARCQRCRWETRVGDVVALARDHLCPVEYLSNQELTLRFASQMVGRIASGAAPAGCRLAASQHLMILQEAGVISKEDVARGLDYGGWSGMPR